MQSVTEEEQTATALPRCQSSHSVYSSYMFSAKEEEEREEDNCRTRK